MSLLSPANLKKMEVQNLYQKQLNSFYAPQRSDGGPAQSVNNSAIVSTHVKDFAKVAPLIQLKADDVV